MITLIKRTALASLMIAAGAVAASAQETTIKVGLVRSISNATNLWGI
jgi:hypothetical protein